MRSAKSSVNGSKIAAMWLTVLIIVVLRALAPGAGWSQETAQPRIDEELKKQEKIFQRQGADVPRGYVTGRGLSDYAELLPSCPNPRFSPSFFQSGNGERG